MDTIFTIRSGNSAGLVTSTAGPDLLHLLGTNRSGVVRSAVVRKIMAYQATGVNITFSLGTRDLAAVPAYVQVLPTLVALNGIENIWTEEMIPALQIAPVLLPLALGREGNIYLQASAVGLTIAIELEEMGL